MLRSRRARSVWYVEQLMMLLPCKMGFLEVLHSSTVAPQFFSRNKKGVGTFAVCAGAPAKASPVLLFNSVLGSEVACSHRNALTLFLSIVQPLAWFPPRRTKEQEHGAVTIWQNQVLVTHKQNRASFFVNRGVWYRRASVAGKQGECVSWCAMCAGMPCCLDNHDGMMDNYSGVSIVSLTVQNCSSFTKGNSILNIFTFRFAFIESLLLGLEVRTVLKISACWMTRNISSF